MLSDFREGTHMCKAFTATVLDKHALSYQRGEFQSDPLINNYATVFAQ